MRFNFRHLLCLLFLDVHDARCIGIVPYPRWPRIIILEFFVFFRFYIILRTRRTSLEFLFLLLNYWENYVFRAALHRRWRFISWWITFWSWVCGDFNMVKSLSISQVSTCYTTNASFHDRIWVLSQVSSPFGNESFHSVLSSCSCCYWQYPDCLSLWRGRK